MSQTSFYAVNELTGSAREHFPVSYDAVQVIGAIDWRLDGYLSGIVAPADCRRKEMLWSIRLQRGAVTGVSCQPMHPKLAYGDLSVSGRAARPWVSLELALTLSARGVIAWPAHAVVCRQADALFVAVAGERDSQVALYRFARGARLSWRIDRPSPGRLTQLFSFEGHVGLIDVPEHGKDETLAGSRLILCSLGEPQPASQCIQLGARCQRPGILNACVAARHCMVDLILSDPAERGSPGRLWRCSVERSSGACSKRLLSPLHVIDAAVQLDRCGRARRFAYLSGVDNRTALSGLCRLDLSGCATQWRSIPFAQTVRGLAILDTSEGNEAESGWLATIVHDHANDRSGIWLWPLKGLATQQHAIIRVPSGVCLGDTLAWSPGALHGCGELAPRTQSQVDV